MLLKQQYEERVGGGRQRGTQTIGDNHTCFLSYNALYKVSNVILFYDTSRNITKPQQQPIARFCQYIKLYFNKYIQNINIFIKLDI